MRIYVGNLAEETGVEELRALFTPHGPVQRARLAKDKETGALRGFAIVEMEDGAARTAIAALHGVVAAGRALRVKEAKPRPIKPNGTIAEAAPGPGSPGAEHPGTGPSAASRPHGT